MFVYLLLANLIVEKEVVARKYAGGIEQFRLDYYIGGDSFNQEDDELFHIARMNIDEFDIDRLIAKGLHYDEEKDFSTDFVIKRRFAEPLWPAPWLQYSGLFAWHNYSGLTGTSWSGLSKHNTKLLATSTLFRSVVICEIVPIIF